MSTQKFWKKLGLGKHSNQDQGVTASTNHRPPVKSRSLSLLSRPKQSNQVNHPPSQLSQQTSVPVLPPVSQSPDDYILVSKEAISTPNNSDAHADPEKGPVTDKDTSIKTLSNDDPVSGLKMGPDSLTTDRNAAPEQPTVPEPQRVSEQAMTTPGRDAHRTSGSHHSETHSFSSFSSSSSYSRAAETTSKTHAPIARAKSADRLPRAIRPRKEASGIPKPSTSQKSNATTPTSSRVDLLSQPSIPLPTSDVAHIEPSTGESTEDEEKKHLKAELDRVQKINEAMNKDLEYLLETMEERDNEKATSEGLRKDLDDLLTSSKRQTTRDAAILEKYKVDLEQQKTEIAELQETIKQQKKTIAHYKQGMEAAQKEAYEQEKRHEHEQRQREDEIATLKRTMEEQVAVLDTLKSYDDVHSPQTPVPGSPSLHAQDKTSDVPTSTTTTPPSTDVPDQELTVLTQQKEKLLSDYSKIPLVGVDYKTNKRKDELEDMLDKVDSQLSKVKQKIRQAPRF